jgi:hypothetical protein
MPTMKLISENNQTSTKTIITGASFLVGSDVFSASLAESSPINRGILY